jgi:hypothetical protein
VPGLTIPGSPEAMDAMGMEPEGGAMDGEPGRMHGKPGTMDGDGMAP